jgi:hypothetical protein
MLLPASTIALADTSTIGATRTVKVKKMEAVVGDTAGSLASLNRRGQWGTESDPSEYVRLTGDFDVRFTYRVLQPPAIGSLAITAVLRGGGDWRLQARDREADRWVTVATDADYATRRWSKRTRAVDPDFLADGAKLQMRLVGSADNLDIDLLVGKRTVWQPGPGTTWQWQLTGTIDKSFDVAMYDVDLFDVPRNVIRRLHDRSRVVICYFSAGAWEEWRSDAGQFPDAVLGADNGWPGERWLDIRQLDVLRPILSDRLDLAVTKGCDGVEPDNVDGYANRSGFPLTQGDQLEFNRWLAKAAHERGLSVGLKNDLEQVIDLVRHFDWALNEQCFQYDECDLLLPFVDAGKAVFGVEYRGSPSSFCPEARDRGFSWLKKRENLGAWVEAC